MIQIKIGRSEDWANIALRGLWEKGHCVRDIRMCQAQNDHYPTIMIIYEDNTQEVQEIIEKYKTSPVQVFPDPLTSTSVSYQDFEGEYSVYLNG